MIKWKKILALEVHDTSIEIESVLFHFDERNPKPKLATVTHQLYSVLKDSNSLAPLTYRWPNVILERCHGLLNQKKKKSFFDSFPTLSGPMVPSKSPWILFELKTPSIQTMSLRSAKLKQYGLIFVAVIGTYHIAMEFIKPLVVPSKQSEMARAEAEHLERMRKI